MPIQNKAIVKVYLSNGIRYLAIDNLAVLSAEAKTDMIRCKPKEEKKKPRTTYNNSNDAEWLRNISDNVIQYIIICAFG